MARENRNGARYCIISILVATSGANPSFRRIGLLTNESYLIGNGMVAHTLAIETRGFSHGGMNMNTRAEKRISKILDIVINLEHDIWNIWQHAYSKGNKHIRMHNGVKHAPGTYAGARCNENVFTNDEFRSLPQRNQEYLRGVYRGCQLSFQGPDIY